MRINEIVEKIKAWHAPLDHPDQTCDTFKCGNPEVECTGIVITCFASMEVIKTAAKKGCNLIISHEPTFYYHDDNLEWLSGDPVFEAKKKLLNDTGMVIWRDHDHIHGPGAPWAATREVNDWIFIGIMKELGWESYLLGDIKKPLWFNLPETTVQTLAADLIKKLDLNGIRIVGNPDAKVKTVFFCQHIMPGFGNDQETIQKSAKADVMIPFEIVDWTLSEYVRDAAQLGMTKAILEMGHFNVEELGMRYMAEAWLPEIIDHAVPVLFIQSGDGFQYQIR